MNRTAFIMLLIVGTGIAQDGGPQGSTVPALAKPETTKVAPNKEVEELKGQLAALRGAITAAQGNIVTLQGQLAEANKSILAARICSDAGLVWAKCQVDQTNWTAKPVEEPKKP